MDQQKIKYLIKLNYGYKLNRIVIYINGIINVWTQIHLLILLLIKVSLKLHGLIHLYILNYSKIQQIRLFLKDLVQLKNSRALRILWKIFAIEVEILILMLVLLED